MHRAPVPKKKPTLLKFTINSSPFHRSLLQCWEKAQAYRKKGGQQWRIHSLKDNVWVREEGFSPGTAGTSSHSNMTATWSSTSTVMVARGLVLIVAPSCSHQTSAPTVALCRKTATSCSTTALGTRRGPLGHGNIQVRGWYWKTTGSLSSVAPRTDSCGREDAERSQLPDKSGGRIG